MHSPGRNSPRSSPHASPRMSATGGAEAADTGRVEKKLAVKIKAPWGKRRASTQVVDRDARMPGTPSPDLAALPVHGSPLPKHITESPRRASAPLIALDARAITELAPETAAAKAATPPPPHSSSSGLLSPASPSSPSLRGEVQTRAKSGRLTGMLKSRRSITSTPSPSAAGVLEVGSAPSTPTMSGRKKSSSKPMWVPFSKTSRAPDDASGDGNTPPGDGEGADDGSNNVPASSSTSSSSNNTSTSNNHNNLTSGFDVLASPNRTLSSGAVTPKTQRGTVKSSGSGSGSGKRTFLPTLLRRGKSDTSNPFARGGDGSGDGGGGGGGGGSLRGGAVSHFEGAPVVLGGFQADFPNGEIPAALSTASVRLEGIPGGIVRAVYSSENMLAVVSQTSDLYIAGSSQQHPSALGQPEAPASPLGSSAGLSVAATIAAAMAASPVPKGAIVGPGSGALPVAAGVATVAAGAPPSAVPTSVPPFRLQRVRGLGSVRRVALGDNHSAAICDDGCVYTWGMNVMDTRWLTQDPAHGKSISSVISGQLGLGASQKRWATPQKVAGVTGPLIDVAVGSTHTVVLTADGVFTCGNQMTLGRPNTDVFDVLMVVPGLASVTVAAVACGWDHTLAVTKGAGAVYSWGLNDHGQLGLPRQHKYAAEPMHVPGSKLVASVAAGAQHSVCISASGDVIVWGSNVCGELGIGSSEDRVFEPRIVGAPLMNEHVVIAASCSRNRTIVVTDAGEVFQAGRFGAGGHTFAPVPMEAQYVGGAAVGATHMVYLIDQALTHIMAQLMQPRTASSEAFLRKLLRLFQVAVDNNSGDLINGLQMRVSRLLWAADQAARPRIMVEQTVLPFLLSNTQRVGNQMFRVVNDSAFRIECNCWLGSTDASVTECVAIKFVPSTFTIDEGESMFVRVEVMLLDEARTVDAVQALAQLSACRVRKHKATGSLGGIASHFFLLDVMFAEGDQERDPALVQHLVDTMGTYVPHAVLRELQANPQPPTGTMTRSFPGAVLFIDVSGFTALNARLAKLGPAGPEQVSTHLNRYFGQLIDVVYLHGGDVLKFAGDALICLFGFPGCSDALPELALRAVQCGCDIQSSLHEYDSQQGFRLKLHIAVGAGDIHMLHLGGVDGHYEHVVMGDPMLQLETGVEASKEGEVVASTEAYALVKDRVTAAQRGPTNYLIAAVTESVTVAARPAPKATPAMEAGLRCFLQTSVLARVEAMHMSWMAELRRVTVIFVNLTSLTYERGRDVRVDAINEVLCSMQHIVFRFEGMVRQFIVDDKGTVLIAAFGVPPFGHEDDPLRGIKAAWEIHNKLQAASVTSSIGVTTGKVFCGSVGSSKRQEYAMVGDIVNLSARLMVVAKKSGGPSIIVDETTRELTEDLVEYEKLAPVTVKGHLEPVSIACPTRIKEVPSDHNQSLQSIMENGGGVEGGMGAPGGGAGGGGGGGGGASDDVGAADGDGDGDGDGDADEGRAAAVAAAVAAAGRDVPIVGRKAELGLLQLQVAQLQAMTNKKTGANTRGGTKTFLLSGAAGMGKTRIINELARVCRKQNVEYYIGQCDSLEKSTPFFVFQTILEQLMNLEMWKQRNQKMMRNELHESMAEHWQANNGSVAAAFGITADSNWAEYLPLLNNVLPLGLAENEMCSKLDSAKRHMLTVSFMAYLIQARAVEKPVVLIVEDLQWIDEASMELLAAVAAETSASTKGTLIMLSQRSPPHHPQYRQLLQLTGVEELKLMPMSVVDCRAVACNHFGVPVTAWLTQLDKAFAKAHGNPYYAIEIAYGLRESGAVDVVDGKLVLNENYRAGAGDVPETIEGLIGSRIDQLQAGPQLLLKVASVVGMEFTAAFLSALYPIATQRNSIAASLKELVGVGLLARMSPTSPVYHFKNDTVRDVVYSRMLFTQRQQLHEKIARYYEEQVRGNQGGASVATEPRLLTRLLAMHWNNAVKDDPEVEPEKLLRVLGYLLSACSQMTEDMEDDVLRYLADAEALVSRLPPTYANESKAASVHIEAKRVAIGLRKTAGAK